MFRRLATVVCLLILGVGLISGTGFGNRETAVSQTVVTYRLSHELGPDATVSKFAVSPNGQWVAYTVWVTGSHSELWITSVSGSAHTKIAEGNLINDYFPSSPAFRFSADSSTLVFGTSWNPGSTDGLSGLAAYDLVNGGPATVLVPPLPQWGVYRIPAYQVSEDGKVVVYHIESSFSRELYRVQDGQAPEKINRPLVVDGMVMNFAIAGAPARIVYSADDVTDNRFEIYSLPLRGAVDQTIKLSHPEADNRTTAWGLFELLGTSNWISFASHPIEGSPTTKYVVPLDGSAPPRELYPAGQTPTYSMATRDGQYVVYSAYGLPSGIFVVPSAGPSSASTFLAPFDKGVHELRLVDQDRFVVWKEYNSDPYDGGVKVAALPPAAPYTRTLVAAGDPLRFGFDSSSRYFYSDGSSQLVSTDLETGSTPVVVDSSASYMNGQGPALSLDGSLLIFLDDMPDTVLRVVPVGGPESATVRIDHQPGSGAALRFQLSANGHSVVYSWSESGTDQLYVADISALLPAPTPTATFAPTATPAPTATSTPTERKVFLPALTR